MRIVSNEEMQKALKDPKIKGMISIESMKYRKQLDRDQIKSSGLIALWRTLQYHDEKKSKFTTNLYRFLHWEFRRELQKNNSKKNIETVSLNKFPNLFTEEKEVEFRDTLNSLDNESYNAVYGVYIEGKKIKEVAEEYKWSLVKAKDYLDIGLKQLTNKEF